MKKILLISGLIAWSAYSFSQAVTSIDIAPFNAMEVGINTLYVDTSMVFYPNILPTNAANKTVVYTVDSGTVCTFNGNKLTCTAEGAVKIKCAAQDGSAVTNSKTYTVKAITKIDSYRLYFNDNNLNVLGDEHFQEPIIHPGEAPKDYIFKMEGDALRINVDKIGPESAPGSGIPSLAWKGFATGFAPIVMRLPDGVVLDMSVNKNIRIKMKGSNAKGHINTGSGVKAPDFRFQFAPCTRGVNCCSGIDSTIKGDTINYYRPRYNMNAKTGNALYDSSDVRYFWIKVNDGITYDLGQGWSQTEAAKSNDFKGSIWVKWIAFGAAADTVQVDSIKIIGEDSILFASKSQKFSYMGIVYPGDATEKTIFWSVDDPTVASIDGSGKLSILKTGSCHVIATAQDGTGITGSKLVKFYYPEGVTPDHFTDYGVYPNPAQDVINISGTSDLAKAELINVSGSVLKSAVSNRIDVLTINIGDLPGGVYILKCYADNGEVIIKKIVKE